MTAADAAALTDANFPTIDPNTFDQIPPAVFAVIHQDRFAVLDPAQAAKITANQAAQMLAVQLEKIPPNALARMPAAAFQRIPPARFANLTAGQANALPGRLLAVLARDKFTNMDPAAVAAIDPRVIRSIPVATLAWTRNAQAAQMTGDQIEAMDDLQVGAIPTPGKCQMSQDVLKRMAIAHYLQQPHAMATIVFEYVKANGFNSLSPAWSGNRYYGNREQYYPALGSGQSYKEFDVFPLMRAPDRDANRVVITAHAPHSGYYSNRHYARPRQL
jgi:hypothetical protein